MSFVMAIKDMQILLNLQIKEAKQFILSNKNKRNGKN
jgi:hypothetical protein